MFGYSLHLRSRKKTTDVSGMFGLFLLRGEEKESTIHGHIAFEMVFSCTFGVFTLVWVVIRTEYLRTDS